MFKRKQVNKIEQEVSVGGRDERLLFENGGNKIGQKEFGVWMVREGLNAAKFSEKRTPLSHFDKQLLPSSPRDNKEKNSSVQ